MKAQESSSGVLGCPKLLKESGCQRLGIQRLGINQPRSQLLAAKKAESYCAQSSLSLYQFFLTPVNKRGTRSFNLSPDGKCVEFFHAFSGWLHNVEIPLYF